MYALPLRCSSRTLQWQTAGSFFLAKFWIVSHFPFAKILLSFGKWVAFITPGARRTETVHKELTLLDTFVRKGWKGGVNNIKDHFGLLPSPSTSILLLILDFLCFRLAKGNNMREVLLPYIDANSGPWVCLGAHSPTKLSCKGWLILCGAQILQQRKILESTVWHEFWWLLVDLSTNLKIFTRTSAIPRSRHWHLVTHIPPSILIQRERQNRPL